MQNSLSAIAPDIDVKDMTIALTGGATGLGAIVVDSLIKLGAAKVIVLDIQAGKLADLKKKYGDKVETITTNLATIEDEGFDALAAEISELSKDASGKPKLDVFFGNAGLLKAAKDPAYVATKDFKKSELRDIFNINCFANAMFFKTLKPLLEESGGRFVFTTSPTAGRTSDTKYPIYGSSKAAQEQLLGCIGTGNPEVPMLAFDPGRLDATGVRAEAYPTEVIGAQPAPEDILAPLLMMMSRGADVAGLHNQVIQVNNVAVKDVQNRNVNARLPAENGQEGFDVIIKKRPLASAPGSGDEIAHYNTAHSREAIGAEPLKPYDPNGPQLQQIFGLPSQTIDLKQK